MVLLFLIYLSILIIETNGEPLYSSRNEDRLNAIEYKLIQTQYDLRETKDRLALTELQYQEQRTINKELENIILRTDSNYLNLKERLELTETELILAKDKLEATDAELFKTKAELKSMDTKLMNTITKPKPTVSNVSFINKKPNEIDAKLNAMLSHSAIATANVRYYPTKPAIAVLDSGNTMAKINTTNLFSGKLEFSSGKHENKTTMSKKVKRVDELPLGSMVAFHAEMGTTDSNINLGQTIKFERVKQNFGNGYDAQLGVFTSPKYGLYFFTFTILSTINKRVDTKLVVNGATIAYSFSVGTPSFHSSSGSKSVIVPLQPGDRVWLELSGHDNTIVGDFWSTFTGFIISAI